MHFGNAWYPEHWPEERWEHDVKLMREAGTTVCRLAEFAWSSIEPTDGCYELEWIDRAITLLNKYGIATVLGTPTAAPPAWVTYYHPDTLAVDPTGRPASHGNRCHASANSPTYLKYSRRVVEHMARRFGNDTRVIGWQIDNEYHRVDYSDTAKRQFQHFLKDRFVTIDKLNEHWSTRYWSQTYDFWEQIPIPVGAHNPGLMLAFRQFVTFTWQEFQRHQIEAIRNNSHCGQWITTNLMGWFDGLDTYKVAKDLDFVSWDWYIGTGHHNYLNTGLIHDLNRGFKQKNFWVMETQPGTVNWSPNNNFLNKGEARVMAFHAAAHGADAFLYWQWRSAPGGQEQLHGSLLGADGNPRPFYEEASQIGSDFKRVSEALKDTTVKADVAILHSYEARWAINAQRHNSEFDPVQYMEQCYHPLARHNVSVDVISPNAPLEDYSLVVAPALNVLPDDTAAHITAWVQAGGVLLLTPRTGHKDEYNALHSTLQPGPLREVAGVEVQEYYSLYDRVPVEASWDGTSCGEGLIWAELLRPLSASTRVVAMYGASNGWLDGKPAATIHPFGEAGGKVIVVGAWLDERLQESLMLWVLAEAGLSGIESPPEVEITVRQAEDGRKVTFVINHGREARSVTLPASTAGQRDLLSDSIVPATISLPAYGVAVLANT